MHSYKAEKFTKCFELIGEIEALNKTSALKDKVKADLKSQNIQNY